MSHPIWIEENNLSPSDLATKLRLLLDYFSNAYKSFIWKMVLIKENNSLIFHSGQIYPIANDQEEPNDIYWDYDKVVLLSLKFSTEKFLENIDNIFQEKKENDQSFYDITLTNLNDSVPIEKIKFPCNQHPTYRFEHRIELYHPRFWDEERQWPYYHIISHSSHEELRVKNLVSRNCPYLKNEDQINHLFFGLIKGYDFRNTLEAIIPTFEFKFKEVFIEASEIKITGEFGSFLNENLCISGIGVAESRNQKDYIFPTKSIVTNETTIILDKPTNIKALDLVVFSSDSNRIVAIKSIYQIPLPEDIIPTLEGMEKAAQRGEDSYLEYKEIFDTNKIIKELAAFANLEGGTVLVGITNEGFLEGVDNSITKVKDSLQNSIANNFLPTIDIAVDGVDLSNNKQIIIIYTPASSNKPVYLRGQYKRIYIRAQGISRPATREEIIQLSRSATTF